MGHGRVLPRSFYGRPSPDVARELVGRVVESVTGAGLVAIRLLEVEAYAGEGDPASHAWRGPTPRTAVMYGPAGHSYVYFTYGMHWCLNVVCEVNGRAAAVLLRAGEVLEGQDLARVRRRPGTTAARLASGPANLATCLGVDGSWNGLDLVARGSVLRLRAGVRVPDELVVVGPRVGITRGVDTPWRFRVADNPHVSGARGARG